MRNYLNSMLRCFAGYGLLKLRPMAISLLASVFLFGAPQARAEDPQIRANYNKAYQLMQSKNYLEASKLLYQMSRMPQYEAYSTQLKFWLGLVYMDMKLYQPAAFAFFDVIAHESANRSKSKYLRQALQKLSIAADALDSEVLLKYAVTKVHEDDFPAETRDMLYFRTGEVKMSEKSFLESAKFFGRVRRDSSFFYKAKYNQGLAYAEGGDTERALLAFDDLIGSTNKLPLTNATRVNALLGKARVLYQKQRWDAAIDAYQDIPRDTEQWHESVFELSWAYFRAAMFRNVLSNLHSLHSPYYEEFYNPESLILRGVVYLYICRFDEMEKVLDLFNRIYQPVREQMRTMLRTNDDPGTYFRELMKVSDQLENVRKGKSVNTSMIPFLVARKILKEGDVRHAISYLHKLEAEKRRVETMGRGWASTGAGKYARTVIEKRMESTRDLLGREIRRHMSLIQNDLRDLDEQAAMARYEMLNGKGQVLKKEIAGKTVIKAKVEEDLAREYFVQNGYEYWPFKGEFWLDEIGNYHYMGVQACEQ